MRMPFAKGRVWAANEKWSKGRRVSRHPGELLGGPKRVAIRYVPRTMKSKNFPSRWLLADARPGRCMNVGCHGWQSMGAST